jgi:REP element-mobilizing transposase RayT
MHCVFSTHNREKRLTEDVRHQLWPYIGGIARENKMSAIAVGGVEDHVHALLSIPPTLSVSKAVQLIKGGSSKWINAELRLPRRFEWQEGYGAFSMSISAVPKAVKYIMDQVEHHRGKTFKEEFELFLKQHNMIVDNYTWS